jgi:putative ABC transport system permease protein
MIARIAFRNLFRQKRRSALTLLTMAGGFVLCAVSIGVADGTYSGLIDMFTRDRVGHIQIHRTGYLDKASLYNTLTNTGALGATLSAQPDVVAWAPRVRSAALSTLANKTSGAQLIGISPALEPQTTRIKHKVSAGRFLSDAPLNEVMLGSGLARILKAGLNDEIVLITQAADGAIANDLFRVVGLAGKPDDPSERMTCYMHISTAQQFLALDGRVHEIAIVLTDQSLAQSTAQRIQTVLNDTTIDVAPWQTVERQFYQAMKTDLEGMNISLSIIMVIVGIGVLNTVLMTILERTREFGVLRALGTRPREVIKLILFETAFLSILSIILGTALSLLGNGLLAQYGITYPEPIEYGGMVFDRMIAKNTFQTIWVPSVLTLGTAVVVSIFPALHAARITPTRAMRTH